MMPCIARDPLRCILPPYLLRNLYTNGPAGRQREVLECMVDTSRMRGRREVTRGQSARVE